MKSKFLIVLFSALLFFKNTGFSCSCVAIETFCETITFGRTGTIDSSLVIVRAKKTRITSTGMEINIKDFLWGTENRTTIEVISGNGADCGISTDIFEQGEEILLALFRRSNGKYMISGCGVNFLRIKNGVVKGNIAPGVNTVSYSRLQRLKQCGGLSSLNFAYAVSLFPNPAISEATLQLRAENPTEVLVSIFDALGKKYNRFNLEFGEAVIHHKIPLDDLPAAVYFVELRVASQRKVFKLLVNK